MVAWFALGESINAVQVAGAAGVVGSVLLLQVRRDSLRKFLRERPHAE
jgi:drug/metabolite transporter (DMT)-like permease